MPYQKYFDQNKWLNKWGNNSGNTYVELRPSINPTDINKLLYNYIQQYSANSRTYSSLFSMKHWRLYDEFENGKPTGGGKIEYVRFFVAIASIILFIACINFMNLATAQSEKRAREVGVRKVLGADKTRLVLQFISEALIMSSIAAVIAVIILLFSLPLFNNLFQSKHSLGLSNPLHVGALLTVGLLCGLVAGSYPAFYLSSFNPIAVIKNTKLKDGSAAVIRKGLVITQFSISIILIISTIIVYRQIQHVKTRALGFNKNNLIELDVQGDMAKNFNAIKQDLLNTENVESVALSDYRTLFNGNNTSDFTWAGKTANSKVLVSMRFVTPGFIKTSGMKITDGRDLTYTDTSKKENVLITKSLEQLIGKGSAVGKVIRHENDTLQLTVVGVVNDFVYGNFYGTPDPVVFLGTSPAHASSMYIRTKPGSRPEETLNHIQKVLKANNPAYPFDYRFIDEQFDRFFSNETLVGEIARIFSVLAVIISCLGLFGLAAYTAERRFKEIGIRKLLGASASGIFMMLAKKFLQLIALSCLVAFPASWWLITNWLKQYTYRVNLEWWVFAAVGALTIVIALITICFQTVKAVFANPVKSLRSE